MNDLYYFAMTIQYSIHPLRSRGFIGTAEKTGSCFNSHTCELRLFVHSWPASSAVYGKNIFNLIPVFLLFLISLSWSLWRRRNTFHEEILTKLVNKWCWIIPDATVESCWMVPQLIENLLHLKSCQNIFNQHCGFDWSQRQAQLAIQDKGVPVNINLCKTNLL